jgi:hypothetical protein
MAIPTSKPLAMSTVQTEFGGTNPINLSEYYGLGNAPASGEITLWADFNGTSSEATVTSVSQQYNWYGDSTLATEDTAVSSALTNESTSSNYGINSYNLYSYVDTGEPWLGKTITAYSNLSIETKLNTYKEQNGHAVFDPPLVIALSSVKYRALDNAGATVAELGTDTHSSTAGATTRTAIDNADITGAMTDAQIKTWLSQGCPLRHRYLDDDASGGTNSASVDTPDVYIVRIKADSITYIP